MPRPRKPKPTDIPEAVLDHFAGPARPMSQAGVDAMTRRFKKALVERMLGGELTHHLGSPPRGTKPETTPTHRNGTTGKTVLTDDGALDIEVPRDRAGSPASTTKSWHSTRGACPSGTFRRSSPRCMRWRCRPS